MTTTRRAALTVAIVALGLIVASQAVGHLHASTSTNRWQTPLPAVTLGAIIGMTYGLLAVGLVLVYRSNRIINFAHGEIGAFAAAFFGLEVVHWRVPYWVAFPIALAAAGLVAAVAEAAVIRQLRRAPRLMSVIATLGVAQLLVLLGSNLNAQTQNSQLYPQPSGLPVFTIGALRITPAYSGMLFLSPVLVLALAVFLKRSRVGIAIRGAAANPEAARMSGVFASRMSTFTWVIAGVLSAFTAILSQPTRGFTTGESFGPSLLLRALTGAVLARMDSMPRALAAGVGIGVVEQLLIWNYPRSGLTEVVLGGVILVVLFSQRRHHGRDEEKGSWAAVQTLRPLPAQLREIWLVRNLGVVVGIAFFAGALLLGATVSNSKGLVLAEICAVTIVGLSIGLLTGLGGQLTLGQFAVAAVGATVSFQVATRSGSFVLAFLYAGLAGAATCLIVGLPALRMRGLMLTVTTLSFALVAPAWLLGQSWMLGRAGGVDPGRPIILGHSLESGTSYFMFALAVLAVVLVLVRSVRTSGFGRLLVAIRDNEDNARAFTIRASAVKAQGYLLAGFLAGIGGALYGHAFSVLNVGAFPTQLSIDVVKITVLGGVSILAGPLLGAILVFGIPAFVPLASGAQAASSFGQLLIILQLPGGLAQLVEPIRDRTAFAIARVLGRSTDGTTHEGSPRDDRVVTTRVMRPPTHSNGRKTSAVLLEAHGLHKSFAGIHAVRDVSLSVQEGETLGLIGPNGAGKTTTFELLSGFTKVDRGRVYFEDEDVTHLGPEARGRLGLIRSFQDAALFSTLTVEETVELAFERVVPTRFSTAVLGRRGRERDKAARARDLVVSFGLEPYAGRQIQELSTGTRRITELACLMALEPRLLLLDEPSSGVAQRETEALGVLLSNLKRDFGLTMVIIEHDIPLVMGLSDRIVAMADGEVIATGSPEEVRADERVVESYLGGSVTAIQRSGARGDDRLLVAKR